LRIAGLARPVNIVTTCGPSACCAIDNHLSAQNLEFPRWEEYYHGIMPHTIYLAQQTAWKNGDRERSIWSALYKTSGVNAAPTKSSPSVKKTKKPQGRARNDNNITEQQ
jgi:hypothetical protein